MKSYEVQILCEAISGELVSGEGSVVISGGVSTDTRTIGEGSLFVALEGERFDAHDFLAQAVDAGASGLVVSRVPEGFDAGETAVIKVPVSMGNAVDLYAKLAALTRSHPCSILVAIISTAMIASSTSSPSAMMSAPREMR